MFVRHLFWPLRNTPGTSPPPPTAALSPPPPPTTVGKWDCERRRKAAAAAAALRLIFPRSPQLRKTRRAAFTLLLLLLPKMTNVKQAETEREDKTSKRKQSLLLRTYSSPNEFHFCFARLVQRIFTAGSSRAGEGGRGVSFSR